MSLKSFSFAAVISLALPVAASAATVQIDAGVTGDPIDDVGVIDVNVGGTYGVTFADSDLAGTLDFLLVNDSLSDVLVEISTTVNQGSSWGFATGVDLWMDGSIDFAEGVATGKTEFRTILAEDSLEYVIAYGDPSVGGQFGNPNITVTVVNPIPVPAAGFLLLGALGGLAALRRKKS